MVEAKKHLRLVFNFTASPLLIGIGIIGKAQVVRIELFDDISLANNCCMVNVRGLDIFHLLLLLSLRIQNFLLMKVGYPLDQVGVALATPSEVPNVLVVTKMFRISKYLYPVSITK